MDVYDKLLIDILKTSLNGEKYTINNREKIKWDNLFKEAKEHKISSLVYYTLDRDMFDLIDSEILDEWKKEVIISNLIEKKHDQDVHRIVEAFNKNNIQYICLKGIYLKELYPKRELRTMSDADILVNKNNYENAKEILLGEGYLCEKDGNSIHEVFNKPGSIEIELHSDLVDKDVINIKSEEFETNVWDNCLEVEFNNMKTKILGKSDLIFHLLFHMIVHAKYMGFGLRQLYDLCLYVKNNEKEIDWEELYDKSCKYEILEFTKGIFYILNEAFDVHIDNIFIQNTKFAKKDIDLLINNIVNSGVYGRKNLNKDFRFIYNNENWHTDDPKLFHNVIKFIFPKVELMGERYKYAKKYKILIPIAWVHRVIFGGIVKNRIFNTIKNINYSINIRKNRNRLIKVFKMPM